MPLQNRVTPESQIIISPEYRGMFMGNRGILHDGNRQLVKQVTGQKRWIICQTEFRSRKRMLMTPGNYTELFFLDEATAFAAGHRPCFECRREAYNRFCVAWPIPNATANIIDQQLHRDRRSPDNSQRRFKLLLNNLPSGVVFCLEGAGSCLWWHRRIFKWSAAGYSLLPAPVIPDTLVEVLTPFSTVQTLRNGYEPTIHESAAGAA